MVSPLTPGPSVSDLHTLELLAEIGIILLMFTVGMEFSIRDLLRVKWVALAGGPLGIVLSVALGLGVAAVAGWPPLEGAMIGIVISVASTMVLARLLLDRGELHSRHGRVMIGITLVEDLAVVALTALVPALGSLEPGRLLVVGLALGKSLAILAPVAYLSAKVVPPLLARVARTRSDELFLLVTLALGLGTAAVAQAAGLSLAAGAFLAGIVISESDYAHETLARLLSLRDAFVAVFFVTIGGLLDPRSVVEHWPLLVDHGGADRGRQVRHSEPDRGPVRLRMAHGHPRRRRARPDRRVLLHPGPDRPRCRPRRPRHLQRHPGHLPHHDPDQRAPDPAGPAADRALGAGTSGASGRARAGGDERRGHLVLCGFGRVGSAVGEALDTFRVPYVVIDNDLDVVRALRTRGVPCLLGNSSRRTLLEAAAVPGAAMMVIAVSEREHARLTVVAARALNPAAPILARAPGPEDRVVLYEAGATEVVQPEFEAGLTFIRHSLARLGLPRERVLAYLERFREATETGRAAEASGFEALPGVAVVEVGAGSLADQSLREAHVRERYGVTVVAIARADGDVVSNPPAEAIIRSGDRLHVFGLPEQIGAFRSAAETEGASTGPAAGDRSRESS